MLNRDISTESGGVVFNTLQRKYLHVALRILPCGDDRVC